MSHKLPLILLFLILALVAAFVVWQYTFRKTSTSVDDQKTDLECTATELVTAFETDETAANALYLGKILEVSGTVEAVTEDSLGISVYLKDQDALAGVMCSFDRQNVESALLLNGTQVTVKGLCTGYLMDVVLNKCLLVQ
jgi:hypothetical protein